MTDTQFDLLLKELERIYFKLDAIESNTEISNGKIDDVESAIVQVGLEIKAIKKKLR